MTHQELQAMTEEFLAKGGKITVCPTRTVLGSRQRDKRTKKED